MIDDLEERFKFHPASTDGKKIAHERVRDDCLTHAKRIDELLPDSREKALAITKLEECMFWSNAAVARYP